MKIRFSLILLFFSAALSAQDAREQKCSPALWDVLQRTSGSERSGQSQLFTLIVQDAASFEQWAIAGGLQPFYRYEPAQILVLADRPAHFRDSVLLREDVLFADLGHATAVEELLVPGHNLYVNTIASVHARRPELDGAGTTLSIKEFRFDSTDIDLSGRYVHATRASATLSVHAGVMASLAAGAGNSDPAGRGVARGSRVQSSDFAGLLPDAPADYELWDIGVQNHSYGIDIENYYGPAARAYDISTLEHPELLHVFSAGNKGGAAAISGTYADLPGFANLSGNFKMAKNVLVVGAVDSFRSVVPFSSQGPAYDGRVKPDLVAFGQNGTSEAAALVSGSAAVLREAFHQKFGFWPASETLRAVLIGSADESGPAGPDYSSGFGNLNLKNAVDLIEGCLVASGSVSEGQQDTFALYLPEKVRHCRIALAWKDMPSAPYAPAGLLQDLDIRVIAPDGATYLPWVLSVAPHPDSLRLPAVPGRDARNTVELVALTAPMPGAWTIVVEGYQLPEGSQAFSLAAYWDTLGDFVWTSPLPAYPLIAGKEAVLHWESTLDAPVGDLEWRYVSANSWSVSAVETPLSTSQRRWLAPDTTAAVQFRMLAEGREFRSDTVLVAPVLRPKIAFSCPDSALVHWSGHAADVWYRVWGLGARYQEPLFLTRDTAWVVPRAGYPQRHFAVSVLHADGAPEGPASGTPDLAAEGIGCYLRSFIAIPDGPGVQLSLEIGSLYGIRLIRFEKQIDGGWVALEAFDPDALQFSDMDLTPAAGRNIYRAVLEMSNGAFLVSEAVAVYFIETGSSLLLPNPAESGGMLTVLSGSDQEATHFLLYDPAGRLVMERPLDGAFTQFVLPSLPAACYIYTVRGAASGILARGRFIVRP